MHTYAVIANYRGKHADFDIQYHSMGQAQQLVTKLLQEDTDWEVISVLHV